MFSLEIFDRIQIYLHIRHVMVFIQQIHQWNNAIHNNIFMNKHLFMLTNVKTFVDFKLWEEQHPINLVFQFFCTFENFLKKC